MKKRTLAQRIWKVRLLYLMFIPTIVYFIIFKYLPMYGVTIAFKDYSPFLGVFGSPWVGMEHFDRIFSDPYFYKLILNTFLLSIYGMFWGWPVPLIFSLLLNEVRFPFYKRMVQSFSLLPYFISTAVSVSILYSFLSIQDGMVNIVLQKVFDMKPIFFMADENYFRSLYIGLNIWKGFGYGAIIYLAAMTAIDPQLYEAAEVDGATRWKKMWHITLPGIKNTIIILLILNVGSMLGADLETILLMYNPNLYDVADVIQTYVFRKAFPEGGFPQYSYGTAVGLFQSFVAMVLIVFANFLARKYSETRLF